METKVRWTRRGSDDGQPSESELLRNYHASYASTSSEQRFVPAVPQVNHAEERVRRCPNCSNPLSEQITRKFTKAQHLMALLLCCFGCWVGACCPYLIESCKDDFYYCDFCKCYVVKSKY